MSTDIDWPGTLPKVLRLSGLSNSLPNLTIRSQMDIGPAKVRRRTTAAVEPVAGSIVLTEQQTESLDTFFITTLKGGALSFNWIHPRTLTPVEMRMVSPPKYDSAQGLFIATLDLEVLP